MRNFFINDERLNFLVCGQLVNKDNFLHSRRILEENVFIFVLEGTLFINSNNTNYTVHKNQFIILKAGEEHFGYKESNGSLKYYWVHFSNTVNLKEKKIINYITSDKSSLLNQEQSFQKASFYYFPETGTFENNTRFLLLFRQMMDFSLDNNINKTILDYSLSILMMEFSQSLHKQNENSNKEIPSIISDICHWIKNNYQNNFTIEELSQEFKYQSSYLSNLFSKNMNMSIIQYTNRVRISAAKNLLSNFSVKETAYSCGFDDEKYFMKIFKKIEGITPGQYKQAFNKKNINS